MSTRGHIRVSLIAAAIWAGFWIAGLPALNQAGGAPPASTAFVFKLDGTRHCDPFPGESLESMAQPLTFGGIGIVSSRKGFDGREGVAVCGTPTGGINIYEIAASDLPEALRLGFQRLPSDWIRP